VKQPNDIVDSDWLPVPVHTSLIKLEGQYSNRFIRLEAALLLRLHGIIIHRNCN